MRLLCFGDSNTYGYDPRSTFGGRYAPKDRWPDLLAQKTGWEVINRGENGREIPHHPHTLRQAAELVAGLGPGDAVLVLLGTNDLLLGLTPEQVNGRMETLLQTLLPLGRRLILVTPPPMVRGAWVPEDSLVTAVARLGEGYRLLAEKLGVGLVDTAGWPLELAFDGVHLTEAGHHAFAERLSGELGSVLGEE